MVAKRHRSRRDLCDEVRVGSGKIRLFCWKNYTFFGVFNAAFGQKQNCANTASYTHFLSLKFLCLWSAAAPQVHCSKGVGGLLPSGCRLRILEKPACTTTKSQRRVQGAPPKRHRSRRDLCEEVRDGSGKIRLFWWKNYTFFGAFEAAFGQKQTSANTASFIHFLLANFWCLWNAAAAQS